jgi:hypothetical protein
MDPRDYQDAHVGKILHSIQSVEIEGVEVRGARAGLDQPLMRSFILFHFHIYLE